MSLTLKTPVSQELIVKKSRFIAFVEPMASVQQAKARLNDIRAQFPDARHVCFAFYVESQTGLGDDGEPSGTAAKPMFNVLSHKKLVNVLAVVVRYFGGVKLGAGGLARAYGGAIAEALESAEMTKLEAIKTIELSFAFALEAEIRRAIKPLGAELTELSYSDNVNALVCLPESQAILAYEALLAVAPGSSSLSVRWADQANPR